MLVQKTVFWSQIWSKNIPKKKFIKKNVLSDFFL